MIALSAAALSLLRRHVEKHGQVEVDASTREAYRELARAGLMVAVHTFAGGDESAYKLAKAGFERKGELLARAREAG
jgi:hypothetical protein